MKTRITTLGISLFVLVGLGMVSHSVITQSPKQPIKLEAAVTKVSDTPTAPVTTQTATVAPVVPTKATVTPKQTVATTTISDPKPAPTPQTGTEWLIAYNNTHTTDETSCMVGIILKRQGSDAPGNLPPSTLQSDEEYALAHYPSICFAEAAASRSNY